MSRTAEHFCIWSGVVFATLFGAGMILAGFLPPPSPMLTGEQVVTHFHTHPMKLAMILLIACAGFMVPFTGILAQRMRQMQGVGRALAYTQLTAGAANMILFIEPALVWSAATYRPERNVELTYLLFDLGWLMFILPFTLGFIQNISLGIGVLLDRGATPVFPRWYGYLNLWIGLLFVPGVIGILFKSGPFAWNGILAFWLPAFALSLWLIVTIVLLLKGVGSDHD